MFYSTRKKASEPKISERFDVDDIRRIRDYNASRHSEMSDGKISVFEDGHVLYEDIPATTNLKVICFNFYSLFCP